MYARVIKIALILSIGLSLILAAWFVLHGSINFHTDIARDFLLFEDIYYNKNITLIGPRSGGISGVFHGPLWLYVNIPVYALSGGNPVAVGWFWVFVYAVSVGIIYYIGRKMYDETIGLAAASLYAISTVRTVNALFNPFGAVILFPLFFYFFWLYIKKDHFRDLFWSLFFLGFSIQFQMAFAVPILVIITPYIFYHNWKTKKWMHLLAFVILGIPLSSFILFDLRHDFLQTKAVLTYLSTPANAKDNLSFIQVITTRLLAMAKDVTGMLVGYLWLNITIVGVLLVTAYRRARKDDKMIYTLFLILYFGYWIITLPYKGIIWGYYTWPFVGVAALMIAATLRQTNKKIFTIVFGFLCMYSLYLSIQNTVLYQFPKDDTSQWKFYKHIAEKIYKNAPQEFGYYIYTTDQFGYSARYAMNYIQHRETAKKSFPYQKKPTTYLLIDDPGNHAYTNSKGWREYDVKITKKPISREYYSKTYRIETYKLTDKEVAIESNPNLLHGLIFR